MGEGEVTETVLMNKPPKPTDEAVNPNTPDLPVTQIDGTEHEIHYAPQSQDASDPPFSSMIVAKGMILILIGAMKKLLRHIICFAFMGQIFSARSLRSLFIHQNPPFHQTATQPPKPTDEAVNPNTPDLPVTQIDGTEHEIHYAPQSQDASDPPFSSMIVAKGMILILIGAMKKLLRHIICFAFMGQIFSARSLRSLFIHQNPPFHQTATQVNKISSTVAQIIKYVNIQVQ
ncbi:hypothetical protein RF11_04268 [Thelohanellus kitauei]|uniref:Uncharacterized protein n=1 Tax=Thelohanellus kitauei TaxID=669202 RepID=A0A0C2NCH8_THEKT|nr:hypothetical protein RF11_04268 [Thelohanellus kitauei]